MDVADGLITPRLRAHFGYRRFQGGPLRVLLLEPRYHVAGECRRALAALGHDVLPVPVPGDLDVDGGWLREVLVAAARHRPDFVLSINHLGFDTRGVLAGLLDRLEVPTAVWYVDSPEFILLGARANVTPTVSLFLWERALAPEMRALGFEEVHHLPLAADGTRPAPEARLVERPLGFLGDSMVRPVKEWGERVPPALRRRCERAAEALLRDRRTSRRRLLDLSGTASRPPSERACVLACATLLATSRYRLGVLAALPARMLHLHGDAGWRELLPEATWHGPTRYEDETPRVYAGTAINLNATSLQMPTAVNQRVFDVPASGGFLLTDAQEDLLELFPDPGEVATYASPEEAREKALWFLDRPEARARIVAAARARIAAAHTYVHRARAMVEAMRRRYAPRPAASAPEARTG